uniref:BXMart1-3 minibinder n=1 Tax=synthetic construct TaxID=32630 RepID=UPI003F77887C
DPLKRLTELALEALRDEPHVPPEDRPLVTLLQIALNLAINVVVNRRHLGRTDPEHDRKLLEELEEIRKLPREEAEKRLEELIERLEEENEKLAEEEVKQFRS